MKRPCFLACVLCLVLTGSAIAQLDWPEDWPPMPPGFEEFYLANLNSSMEVPDPEDPGDPGDPSEAPPMGSGYVRNWTTNDLWLEVAVINAVAYIAIHPQESDGTNAVFDLLMTTNLSATVPGLNLTNWMWVCRTDPGETSLALTNLPPEQAYFLIARTNDADGDGLSDGCEHFIYHTDPAIPNTPIIISQPESQTVKSGCVVNLSIVAPGALAYQWRKNGTNIPSATNSVLTLSSAGALDRGTYAIVVTNTVGSVTSAPAVLSVIMDWYATAKEYMRAFDVDNGIGTSDYPWDLKNALENKGDEILPGDTLWLMAGTYHHSFIYGGSAAFNFTDWTNTNQPQPLPTIIYPNVSGLAGSLITIRALPGARATIDGCLNLAGYAPSYLRFQDLEIAMLTYTNRYTGVSTYYDWACLKEDGITNSNTIINRSGIHLVDANQGIEIINCVVHDCINTGLGGGANIYYGCLVYNNGFFNADPTNSSVKAKGYGFYVQNKDPNAFPIFKNTIICNNAKGGFQANSQSGANIYNNIWLDGITSYQNGHLAGLQANGAHDDNEGNDIDWAYQGSSSAPFINCGFVNLNFWNSGQPDAGTYQSFDNSGTPAQNTFWFTNCIIACQHPTNEYGLISLNWYLPSENVICQNNSFFGGNFNNIRNQFTNNVFRESCPLSGTNVIVQPNEYELGRANIIVYNWSMAPSVQVDLSNIGLTNGASYELHQCQDYYGDVTNGIFDGSSITIQMTNHSVAVPVGKNFHPAPTSFPQFGAFIIRKHQ